jgi:hypothetical protein
MRSECSVFAEYAQMGHSDISTTKKLYYFSNKTMKNKEKQIENAISF